MADNTLEQLAELFDKKLSPINQRLDKFESHVTEQLTGVNRELQTINTRLDTVAKHLVETNGRLAASESRLDTIDEGLKTVLETQQDQGQQLTRIERNLVKHDDRLEALEANTAHLPDRSL
jgi:chromosome segregation ATPase